MEEPNRLDKLYNFPAKDILIPSLKVGALSGKAIIYVYGILHTLLYHQDSAFVLMGILIFPIVAVCCDSVSRQVALYVQKNDKYPGNPSLAKLM